MYFNCGDEYNDKKNIKKSEDKIEGKNLTNNICFEESNINNDIKNLSNKKTNNIEDYSFSNNPNINIKKNLFTQNNKIIKDQQQRIKQTNPFMPSPYKYPKILFQNNNYQKMPPFNPLLANQIINPNNPLFLQNALFLQNYMRLQQQYQMNNKINNTSKDSSPIMNYQSKNNNILNTNNNNIKNIKMDKNNIISHNNLEEIVQNKQYKEYVPKNLKEKENDVQFQTNSTRDYQYKYVSRYIVQIENEKNFPVTKMIIGNNGMLLRKILLDNCIKYGDHTTKIRLRGKGSGYKEGINNEESKDPMELCISSLNVVSFSRCSSAIENLLLKIYYQYYLYQCKNANNSNNKNSNSPIAMKIILKYHYVVNRYNTLVKEEKRRKKEEEANKINQNNNNNDNNHNNGNYINFSS